MADGYSHGHPRPVDPDAEAEHLAGRHRPAVTVTCHAGDLDGEGEGFPFIVELIDVADKHAAKTGHTVHIEAWAGGRPADIPPAGNPLAERVRSLATRDRTRG